jgi:hypothetical protein
MAARERRAERRRAAAGAPTKGEINTLEERNVLVLYDDDIGRKYAFCPADLVPDADDVDRVIDEGYAYVMLKPRRKHTGDKLEEDLGACAPPGVGDVVKMYKVRARTSKGLSGRLPNGITVSVEDVYRQGTRTTAKIEFKIIERS